MSLADACFECDTTEAKIVVKIVQMENGTRFPEILRVSAAARALHDELGVPLIIGGNVHEQLAVTPTSLVATVARNCHLLCTMGHFTTTTWQNNKLFTAIGRRYSYDCAQCRDQCDCPHAEYLIQFKEESLTDRIVILGIFDETTDAKALLVNHDNFPKIVRATSPWIRLLRPPTCDISHLASEFLPSILSPDNFRRISKHWADAMNGVYYEITINHNGRRISGRINYLSNDLYFLMCEDVTHLQTPTQELQTLRDEVRTMQSELEQRNRIIETMRPRAEDDDNDDNNSSSVHSGSSWQSSSSHTFSYPDVSLADSTRWEVSKLPAVAMHEEKFTHMREWIRTLPLNTPEDKVRVYLYQMTVAAHARASTADMEAVAQLGAYTLRSTSEGKFFVSLNSIPSTADVISGLDHRAHPQIVAFYREHLYALKPDEFWTTMLDDKAVTFLVRYEGRIVGAQTVKICHTLLGDPVFYVSLIACIPGEYEKPSRVLAAELKRFACSFVEIGSVAHILAQSVGYRYRNVTGVVYIQKHSAGERGRYYWCKHLDPDDAATLMGAQLATIDDFAEGDCQFMHKELRRLQ